MTASLCLLSSAVVGLGLGWVAIGSNNITRMVGLAVILVGAVGLCVTAPAVLS